jgi:uncharacterized protein YbjT (DUF2867 family)
MDTVLVTGGTGHLGRDVVTQLQQRDHQVRILARTPGQDPAIDWIRGDLATGEGIAQAVTGAHTIVHAATLSPAAKRGGFRLGDFFGSPSDVDVQGTRRLLAEAKRAGASHFLYVSIVGVQASRVPYSRVKAAAEDLVRQADLPWSIVPATGFYWLLGHLLDNLAGRRIWPLPANLPMQPVDSADFAAYVAECVAAEPRGDREGFGGPEVLTPVQLAQQYQDARGIRRRILRLRLPTAAIRAAGPQTCPDGQHGQTTWAQWLRQRASGAVRSGRGRMAAGADQARRS